MATSNAGLVLLTPDCHHKATHTAGPIAAVDMVEVGAPFDTSVSFAAEDTTARHNVIWSITTTSLLAPVAPARLLME